LVCITSGEKIKTINHYKTTTYA